MRLCTAASSIASLHVLSTSPVTWHCSIQPAQRACTQHDPLPYGCRYTIIKDGDRRLYMPNSNFITSSFMVLDSPKEGVKRSAGVQTDTPQPRPQQLPLDVPGAGFRYGRYPPEEFERQYMVHRCVAGCSWRRRLLAGGLAVLGGFSDPGQAAQVTLVHPLLALRHVPMGWQSQARHLCICKAHNLARLRS